MQKIFSRIGLILAAALFFLPLIFIVMLKMADKTNGELISSGKKRKYLLYVPKSHDPSKPTPLVISIHGFAEWPAHQQDISGWNRLADEHGFVVVYPSGSRFFPRFWRIFNEPGNPPADSEPDVRFISDLIDKLQREYNIDPARIYANGLSNGGGMSFLLACKLSARIAAIGGVSGAYLTPWSECCQQRAVPMIAFHGTADRIVPYQGGPSRSFHQIVFPNIPEWITELARRYACDPQSIRLPQVGEVSGIQFSNRAANVDVVLYTLEGAGHSWPGGKPLPEWITGSTSQSVDATALIWQFFQAHPLE